MKNIASTMKSEGKLSVKKSIKLLKDIALWGVMVMWILFLTVLLSSSANAQTVELDWDKPVKIENREYRLVEVDNFGNATVSFKEFDTNGNCTISGSYYNNKANGTWTMYDEQGRAVSKAYYVDGKIRSHKFVADNRRMSVKYRNGRRQYICSF